MTLRPDDLETGMLGEEQAKLERLAARLQREKPVPRASYRGDLRRRLVTGGPTIEPRRRRRLALGSLLTGTALLAFAAAGVADIGPLAPSAPGELVAWVL